MDTTKDSPERAFNGAIDAKSLTRPAGVKKPTKRRTKKKRAESVEPKADKKAPKRKRSREPTSDAAATDDDTETDGDATDMDVAQPREASVAPPQAVTSEVVTDTSAASGEKVTQQEAAPATLYNPTLGRLLLATQLGQSGDAKLDIAPVEPKSNRYSTHFAEENLELTQCTDGGSLFWNVVNFVRDAGSAPGMKLSFITLTREDMRAPPNLYAKAPGTLEMAPFFRKHCNDFDSGVLTEQDTLRVSNKRLMWRVEESTTRKTSVSGNVFVTRAASWGTDRLHPNEWRQKYAFEPFAHDLQHLIKLALGVAKLRTHDGNKTPLELQQTAAQHMLHTECKVGDAQYAAPRLVPPQLFRCEVYDSQVQMLQVECYVYALCHQMAMAIVQTVVSNSNYTNTSDRSADIVVSRMDNTDCLTGFLFVLAPSKPLLASPGKRDDFWHREVSNKQMRAARDQRLHDTMYKDPPHKQKACQWYHNIAWD